MSHFGVYDSPRARGARSAPLSRERGKDTERWLGVSHSNYDNKYFSLLIGLVHYISTEV
jgi:hypothetical protein